MFGFKKKYSGLFLVLYFLFTCSSFAEEKNVLDEEKLNTTLAMGAMILANDNLSQSDIEIAREARMKQIDEVGKKLQIPAEALMQYGPHKAKLSFEYINKLNIYSL